MTVMLAVTAIFQRRACLLVVLSRIILRFEPRGSEENNS